MMNRNVNRIWTGLAAATLVLSLAACGDDPAAPTQSELESTQDSEDPPLQQEPAEDYAIDECLVGVWTTVSQRETTTVNNEQVVLIDVQRQLSFASDGVEVVTYFDTPAVVQSPTGEGLGEVVQTGELTYQVDTDEAGTMGFDPTGGEVTANFTIRGAPLTVSATGGSTPVAYTCSPTELTQSATGYEAVFQHAA